MAAPPVPLYNWTGFYVGGNLGYGWGTGNLHYNDPSLGSFGLPTSFPGSDPMHDQLQGVIGGFQSGYNWQLNNSWVTGLETDFQFSSQRASRAFNFPYNDGESSGSLSGRLSSKIMWFGTVRGRIGYLIDPMTLVYATGGLAYGKVNVSGSFLDTLGCSPCSWSFNESAIKAGWVLGGGIEGAFPSPVGWKNWTWKLEYLHIDLGTFSGTGLNPDFGGTYYWNAKFTNDIVRVGVNYHIH